MSRVTAYINLNGMKRGVLKALQQRVGNRARITVFGDRWILRTRTGAHIVLPDVESLAHTLIHKGLAEHSTLRQAPGTMNLEATIGTHKGRHPPPLSAEELTHMLLTHPGAARGSD